MSSRTWVWSTEGECLRERDGARTRQRRCGQAVSILQIIGGVIRTFNKTLIIRLCRLTKLSNGPISSCRGSMSTGSSVTLKHQLLSSKLTRQKGSEYSSGVFMRFW